MDQLILFLKPNKIVRREKKINHSISQTKHTYINNSRTLAVGRVRCDRLCDHVTDVMGKQKQQWM
jgi:hypothetical protein